jgi:hypothetical protein
LETLVVLQSVISYANKVVTVELRQIRSFLSIAETLHFGRTAELIHISQPALSLQIRALEEEVGVRLFERDRRKTTLTAAGVAFRNDAAAALSQLDQAIRKARLAADGTLGLLRVDDGEIRRERLNHLDCCKADGTLPHDMKFRKLIEECGQAFAQNGVIVREYN